MCVDGTMMPCQEGYYCHMDAVHEVVRELPCEADHYSHPGFNACLPCGLWFCQY